MKKLFFTLALVLSVMVLSAQFTVTESDTGNTVTNGATYEVFGDGSAAFGELVIEFRVTAFEPVRMVGEKIENNVVPGTSNYICFGQCLSPSVYVTPPVMLYENQGEMFSMHYVADDYMTVLNQEQSMTYHIYDANVPGSPFVINVIFKYTYDGTEDYDSAEVFSNAYPMPACDVVNFDYNFASSVDAEVAIYNMMGQEVLRNELNGMSGKASINVSDLADGIYFYSLIVNGKTEKSSKLIIRK